MTRQDTLETISTLLSRQPQEKLEALLDWLEQEDDAFEQRLRADADAGKFDQLIAAVIAEDEIVKEVREARLQLEQEADNDLDKLYQRALAVQSEVATALVSKPLQGASSFASERA